MRNAIFPFELLEGIKLFKSHSYFLVSYLILSYRNRLHFNKWMLTPAFLANPSK